LPEVSPLVHRRCLVRKGHLAGGFGFRQRLLFM
jgi:hypothetical protein